MALCCLELVGKRAYFIAIALTCLADLAICVLLFFIGKYDDKEAHDKNLYAASLNDTITCCIARLVSFPLLAFIAFQVYHRTASKSPLIRLKQQEDQRQRELEQAQEQQQQSMVTITPSNSTVEGGGLDIPLNGGLDIPLNGGSDSIVSNGSAATTAIDEKAEAKAAFERKQEHTLTMKRADRSRNVVLGVFFLWTTGMSMYNGLKCVDFHYDPSIIILQASLLSTVIFFINFEFFLIRDFLTKLTEEEGELIPHLHMHPFFFETDLKCHQCDICHESTKPPHYVAYRCRTCDFDLCPRCYRQKDKPSAKGFGGRGIRRDGEQLTTWTFFLRIMKLSMDFKCSMGSAVTCLILAQLLIVWMPKVQGKIFDSLISYLQDPEGTGRSVFETTMVQYLALNFLMGLFGGLKGLFQELVMRQIACAVRSQLFSSVIRMDIAFFDGMHTGQLTSRLTNDASQMATPLQTLMNDLLANLIQLAGGMIMAFETSWKL